MTRYSTWMLFVLMIIFFPAVGQVDTTKVSTKIQHLMMNFQSGLHTTSSGDCCLGEGCSEPLTDPFAEKVSAAFSVDELVWLTDYPEPIVRAYAFLTLTQSNYRFLEDIMFTHLSDTAFLHENKYDIAPFYCERVSYFIIDRFVEEGYAFTRMSEASYRKQARLRAYPVTFIEIEVSPEDLK